MNDTEALMWRAEKDPHLASSFANITVLDRPPDFDTFVARMERTAMLFPRLRRRVQMPPGGIGNPSWADDPTFDIRFHVRRMALPAPGTMRQLQDLVTILLSDPLDRTRPLWHIYVIDGLAGGESALVLKMHHSITDGEGGLRMTMLYLDAERDPAPLPPVDPDLVAEASRAKEPDAAEALRGAMNDSLRIPLAVLGQIRDVLSDPRQIAGVATSTTATVRGLLAQLSDTDAARSPLWRERSLRRRIEVVRVPYADMRAASKALGGTLNTAFVTAAAHAAGRYHDLMGSPVDALRASMAISTRTSADEGNAFALVRMLIPTAEMPVADRFAAVNAALSAARTGSEKGALGAIAALATVLPTSVITRLARSQAETVDFATSNVRGSKYPLYVAGSRIIGNYPLGPLGGVAFNLTLLSYEGNLDIGINIDEAAVEHPDLLRDSLEVSFAQLSALAPAETRAAAPATVTEKVTEPTVEPAEAADSPASSGSASRGRWFRRSR